MTLDIIMVRLINWICPPSTHLHTCQKDAPIIDQHKQLRAPGKPNYRLVHCEVRRIGQMHVFYYQDLLTRFCEYSTCIFNASQVSQALRKPSDRDLVGKVPKFVARLNFLPLDNGRIWTYRF